MSIFWGTVQLHKHIYPIIGDKYLEDISPSDIQVIFNTMGTDCTQQTKHKTKIPLTQIFKMAVDDGILTRNPMDSSSIKIKGAASTETKPYSIEEMRYLAAHLDDISDPTAKAWLALSISAPMRPEEVLGLRWQDIDTKDCLLNIRATVTHPTRNQPEFKPYTKTASSVRTLSISPEIIRRLPPEGNPEDFIIGGAEPLSYTVLRRMRTKIANEINFKGQITPRRFRTTIATDISATTHDLKLVQRSLGHSTPQMTLKHYDKGRNTTVDAAKAISDCYGL